MRNWPNWVGMEPINDLEGRAKIVRLDRMHKLNEVKDSNKLVKLDRFPISDGILPCKKLEDNSKSSMYVRFPVSVKMLPHKGTQRQIFQTW